MKTHVTNDGNSAHASYERTGANGEKIGGSVSGKKQNVENILAQIDAEERMVLNAEHAKHRIDPDRMVVNLPPATEAAVTEEPLIRPTMNFGNENEYKHPSEDPDAPLVRPTMNFDKVPKQRQSSGATHGSGTQEPLVRPKWDDFD